MPLSEKVEEKYHIETKKYLVDIEFDKGMKDISVWIKDNDEDSPDKTYIHFDTDEQVSDFYDIFKEIYRLNMGEKEWPNKLME